MKNTTIISVGLGLVFVATAGYFGKKYIDKITEQDEETNTLEQTTKDNVVTVPAGNGSTEKIDTTPKVSGGTRFSIIVPKGKKVNVRLAAGLKGEIAAPLKASTFFGKATGIVRTVDNTVWVQMVMDDKFLKYTASFKKYFKPNTNYYVAIQFLKDVTGYKDAVVPQSDSIFY